MIEEIAPAKLNLALHVRARRSDGYHDIETLFVFTRDGDRLELAPAERDGFELVGPFAAALQGEGDNLVTRARDGFRKAFGVADPVAIMLDKRLPVASGIGGGSADAAATLRAMAAMHMTDPDDPRLFGCAAALGADVPACLRSVTALGSGTGEALVAIEGMPEAPVLLVNPGVGVSTAAVFSRWDGVDRGAMPSGDLLSRALEGRNDLERPALAIAPAIGEVIAALNEQEGARLVRMSGSGATCFALFSDPERCADAARSIGEARPDWWIMETVLL